MRHIFKGRTLNRFKRAAAYLMTIVMLMAFFNIPMTLGYVQSAYAQESPSATITGNDFNEIIIRKGSDTGEVVSIIKNSEASGNAGVLEAGVEYYLCMSAKSPQGNPGEAGYVSVSLGNSINGVVYTNVPGNRYVAGAIEHDSFTELLSYVDYHDPTYGSDNTAYKMQDGKLVYKLNSEKMGGQNISFSVGFKVDENYWWGEGLIIDALQVEMGTIGEGDVLHCADLLKADIGLNSTASKYNYIVNSAKSVNVQTDKMSPKICLTFSCTGTRTMIYDEIGYDVTYPAGTLLSYFSHSASENDIKTHRIYGTICAGEEQINGDGTVTRHITLEHGRQNTSSINMGYLAYTFPSDKFTSNTKQTVTYSNIYYISSGSGTKQYINYSNTTQKSQSTSYNVVDDLGDGTTLMTLNRVVSTSTGMGGVYNWNVGREKDDYIKTTSLLGGCVIKNTDTELPTPESKTMTAYYNTTDEQVNISYVTFPVCLEKSGDSQYLQKQDITIKWTGLDAEGNEISGIKNINRSGSNKFVVFSAESVGAVSICSASADIGYLPAGYTSCGWSLTGSFAGNQSAAFGYCKDDKVGNLIKCTFEITNTSGAVETYSSSIQSNAETTGIPSVYFQNTVSLAPEKANIVAGESVKNIKLSLTPSYVVSAGTVDKPGSNTVVLVNPVVILKLPSGMSYSDLSFSVKYNDKAGVRNTETINNLSYKVDNITYMNTSGDGVNLYKITFNDDIVLGYMDQYGREGSLAMNITFDTDKSIKESTTYDFNDLINVTSENCINAATYSAISAYSCGVEDIYAINEGNSLGGCCSDNAALRGIAFQKLSDITVANAMSISKIDGVTIPEQERSWNTYDVSNPNSIVFLGLKSEGMYRVTVNNPSSNTARDYKMFIPIPHKSLNMGTMFSPQEFQYDMKLEAESIPEGFKAVYVKIAGEVAKGTQVKDISYIKVGQEDANAILITADSIPSKKESSLLFKFSIDNNTSEGVSPGMIDIWRNCDSYTVSGNDKQDTGNYVAAEIAIANISGIVFMDENNNGLMDENEYGQQGVTVNAKDSKGRIQSAVTDEDGRYVFKQVREDNIHITMLVPSNSSYKFVHAPIADAPEGGSRYTLVSPVANGKSAAYEIDTASGEEIVDAAVIGVRTVAYNKNGANSGQAPINEEYVAGSTVTVAVQPSAMLKTGYDFMGWSKEAGSQVADYQPGGTFVITDDVELFAVWKVKTLNITFDYQEGTSSGHIGQKCVTYGKYYGAADAEGNTWPSNPVKEGWIFWKWELPTSGVLGYGNLVGSRSVCKLESDACLRAVYSKLETNSDTIRAVYGASTTETAPLYDLSKKIRVINDANSTNPVTYTLNSQSDVLPQGLVFSSDYSKIYGTPSQVTQDTVYIKINVKAKNNITFKYTLGINVSPVEIGSKVTCNPQAGVTLTGDTAVTLTGALSGLLQDSALNSGITATWKVNGDTLGTTNVDPETGCTEITWHPTAEGDYNIAIEYNNLPDMYELNTEENITGYVVSRQPIVFHEILFDKNAEDADNPSSETMKVVEGKIYGTLPSVARPGYSFEGWYTEKENGNKIESDSIVSLGNTASSQSLYAHWYQKQYTVLYDINGANSGAIGNKTVSYNSRSLIPAQEPTKKGYAFAGWYVKGTDTRVTEETAFSAITSDSSLSSITLIAHWSVKTYRVTYDAAGGTLSSTGFAICYGNTYGAKLATPTRTGYTFDGWSDREKIVSSNTVFNFDEDIVLTALWTEKSSYKVVYNTDGGNSIEAKTNVAWTSKKLLPQNQPEKTGYSFRGWVYGDTAVTNDTSYGSLAVYDTNKSITLTALWDIVPYTVTFNANVPEGAGQAEGMQQPITVYYGKSYGPLPAITLNGYSFKGWSDGEGIVSSDTVYSHDENIVLTAVWTDKSGYKVVYNTDGGNSIAAKTNVAWTSKGLLPQNQPEKTGYSLRGWVYGDTAVTNDTTYGSLALNDNIDSVTITALWNLTPYTVTFDANVPEGAGQAEGMQQSMTVHYGESYGSLPAITLDGYSFDGWYKSSIGGEKQAADMIVSDTADFTLYAHWTRINNIRISNVPEMTHLIKTSESGSENQMNLEGAMNEIVYVAEDGYFIPVEYAIIAPNNVEVKRVGNFEIRISGAPVGDNQVVMSPICKKSKPAVPKVTGTHDQIDGTEPSMEYAASADAQNWTKCSSQTTCAPEGKWYVRYAATETSLASDAVMVTVEKASSSEKVEGPSELDSKGINKQDSPSEPQSKEPEKIKEPEVINQVEEIKQPGETNEQTIIPNTGKGLILKLAEGDEDLPKTEIENVVKELYPLLTEDDISKVNDGDTIKIILKVTDINNSISMDEKKQIQSLLENEAIGLYVDLSLYKEYSDGNSQKITEPDCMIKVSIMVPEELWAGEDTSDREYKIIRSHDGELTVINGEYDAQTHMFTFETDRFSTYALIYSIGAGDTGVQPCWILMLLLVIIIFIIIIIYRRRKSRKEDENKKRK